MILRIVLLKLLTRIDDRNDLIDKIQRSGENVQLVAGGYRKRPL